MNDFPTPNKMDSVLVMMMERWQALTLRRGVIDLCDVRIGRQDHWFVLEGKVDSFGTKCDLLALVPEFDGARWIVDRIRVGEMVVDDPLAVGVGLQPADGVHEENNDCCGNPRKRA